MKNIKTITSLILFLEITALSSFGSPDYTGAGGGNLANVDLQNLQYGPVGVRDPEYDEYVILEGEGDVVGENIQHPNGNVFDQILLTGESIKVQAKPGQITRVSFLDENEDIVQAEFSGTGDFTITLDPETFQPAALPARYNQDVKYVTGKPSIVVDGADASTYVSLFTVGRLNAVNENLFPEGQEYDAKADVKLVEVTNCSEIGGMLMGNAEFSGKSGKVGVDARNVKVKQRVTFGDIDASDDAVPYLLFDENAFDDEEGEGPGPMVAGGDLVQTNGAPIVVALPGQKTPSFEGLPTTENFKSDSTYLAKIKPEILVTANFATEDGEKITPEECHCDAGGGLMFPGTTIPDWWVPGSDDDDDDDSGCDDDDDDDSGSDDDDDDDDDSGSDDDDDSSSDDDDDDDSGSDD